MFVLRERLYADPVVQLLRAVDYVTEMVLVDGAVKHCCAEDKQNFNKLLWKSKFCLILQVSPAGLGLPDRSYYYRHSDSPVRVYLIYIILVVFDVF